MIDTNNHNKSYKKGILTIEAALCIPVFLMAMMGLIYLVNIYYANVRIGSAVYEEARLYAIRKYDDSSYGLGEISENIAERLGTNFLDANNIAGGQSGLDFSGSDLSNREIGVISVKYRINIPFGFQAFGGLQFEVRAVTHTWIGYINGLGGFGTGDQYVYMTANGTVYHKNRECSHIKLSILSVNKDELSSLRNTSGGKYKKCDYCHPSLDSARLYVTSDGDRYHNTLSCSGLKRSIIKVKLNDLEGVKPCSRCGY